MRSITLVVVAGAALVSASCGGGSTPVSPTTATPPPVVVDSSSQAGGSGTSGSATTAPAIGLTGVVRGLKAGSATFSLVTRGGTRTVLTDADTQVWNKGTQVRLSSLRDGQSVSIRGYDHTRYVLARTIGIN